MMGERDRLRALQMGVAGHHGVEMAMGERDQRAAEFPGEPDHLGQFVAEIEPQIERDLVVARSRGMELAPRRADPLGQAALDREMDILVGEREAEAAGIDLALDRAQAGDDLGGLGAAQQAGFAQASAHAQSTHGCHDDRGAGRTEAKR